MTNLSLQFSHSSLKLQQLHIKSGLLASQSCNLLLNSRVFSFLESIVSFHFFFNFEILIGEGFAYFLCFQ